MKIIFKNFIILVVNSGYIFLSLFVYFIANEYVWKIFSDKNEKYLNVGLFMDIAIFIIWLAFTIIMFIVNKNQYKKNKKSILNIIIPMAIFAIAVIFLYL